MLRLNSNIEVVKEEEFNLTDIESDKESCDSSASSSSSEGELSGKASLKSPDEQASGAYSAKASLQLAGLDPVIKSFSERVINL